MDFWLNLSLCSRLSTFSSGELESKLIVTTTVAPTKREGRVSQNKQQTTIDLPFGNLALTDVSCERGSDFPAFDKQWT